MRELSRDRLQGPGGRPVYIDADAFVADGQGTTLLAGTPNFVWQLSPAGEINGVASDSIFGAVIARDGTAQLLPAPIDPARIQGIRAAGRPEGGWDVVFAEVAPPPASPTTAVRLWYGVLHREGWTLLERIPAPDSIASHTSFTSALVRHGDTLSWAVVPARLGTRGVALLQQIGDHWVHRTVPTGHTVDVDLAYLDGAGLVLAAVQPDPALQYDENSLLLWAQQPEWHVARRLVHGSGEGPVNDPSLVRMGRDLLATWWTLTGEGSGSRQELRARYFHPDAPDPPMMVLDPEVDMWSQAVPVAAEAGMPLWMVHHGATGTGGANEIRYVSAAGSRAVEIARSPSPYTMRTAVVQPTPGELLVSGWEYKENRFVFSLLLRARLECGRAS